MIIESSRVVFKLWPSYFDYRDNYAYKDTPGWLQKLLSFRYQKPNQIPIEGTVSNPEFEPLLKRERFTLGPGCLAMDDATSTCPMAKLKDLQRRSVLFQYTF